MISFEHFLLHLFSIPMLWTFGVTYKAPTEQYKNKTEASYLLLLLFLCYPYFPVELLNFLIF